MVWYFRSENTEIFDNRLALRARLDAEELSKSDISFKEDHVDIEFYDDPFKGYLLHAERKTNGSISGYVHHFNPVFITLLILILVIILLSDWSGAFKEDLENSIIKPYHIFQFILLTGIIPSFYRSFKLVKTLRLNR